MGPPSQTLPSLNFRQLAPLRSPNLPSSSHTSSYFTQQRNRSTSESVANDALRTLRNPPFLNLPEPPTMSTSSSSTKKGEVLPPLAAFGHTTSATLPFHADSSGRSAKQTLPTQSSHYHPYQQHQPSFQKSMTSSMFRSPPSSHSNQPPSSPRAYYPPMSPQSLHNVASPADHRFYSPASSQANDHSLQDSRESSLMDGDDSNARKLAKSHVPSACLNCKRAHLACDVSRPCRRCINLGKTDTCIDVQHKKRGRPRLRDREAAAVAAAAAEQAELATGSQDHSSGLPGQRLRGSFSSSSSGPTMKRSPRSDASTFLSPAADGSLFSSSAIKAPPSSTSMSSIGPRGRSVSSSISLWSQGARTGAVVAPHEYSDSPSTVTLILSTGLQCARCSIESQALLGFSPSDLLERSLFELVHPSEKQRLEQLWLSLIEPVGVKPQVVPANAETVMTLSPSILMAPAPGTVFMQETMRLRQRSGIFDFYSIRLHLGGGFGADLYQPQSLSRAYIVASLLKLGNDATHPDPNFLREGGWNKREDTRNFSTPQLRGRQGDGGEGGASYHGKKEPFSAEITSPPTRTGHFPPSSAPSRFDWQQLDSDNKPARAPQQQALKEEKHLHLHSAPPPPPYSRSIHRDEYSQNGASDAFHHLPPPQQDSRPRSTHDMDITPPSSAVRTTFDNTASAETTTKSGTGHMVAPSFSYSSRAERGGITC
ncbi:hypothetical protein CBS101457_003178 [Exobasidium rhododendri]|nr:hypothetical protein CBS101457_003178 [Exobasidium rhododendri]